jgi:hypothetical protein
VTFPNTGHHGILFLDELTEFRAKIDLPKRHLTEALGRAASSLTRS